MLPHIKPLANIMKTAGQDNSVKAMKVFKLTHLDGLCTSPGYMWETNSANGNVRLLSTC